MVHGLKILSSMLKTNNYLFTYIYKFLVLLCTVHHWMLKRIKTAVCETENIFPVQLTSPIHLIFQSMYVTTTFKDP